MVDHTNDPKRSAQRRVPAEVGEAGEADNKKNGLNSMAYCLHCSGQNSLLAAMERVYVDLLSVCD